MPRPPASTASESTGERGRPSPTRRTRSVSTPSASPRPGRPRGTCRCRRSGRTCAASCACPSSAAPSRRGARTPSPQSFGSIRPKSGQHAVEPGELHPRRLGERLRRDERRRQQLAAEREQVVERAVSSGAGEPRSSRAQPERLEHGLAQVVGERHLRALPRRARASDLEAGVRVDAPRARGARSAARPSNGSPEACASRWRTVEPGGPAGSSRSTIALLRGDEHASAVSELRDRRPAELARRVPVRRATRRRARTTATAACSRAPAVDLPQRLHARRY